MKKDAKVCTNCGKRTSNNGLQIALMAILGVLVVAVMAGVVYVGTNGWPDFGGDSSVASGATTPTDGNPDDVTCKGTYTVSDEALIAAKDTVVARIGNATLTNGQLQIYYWMNVGDFLNYYGSYAAYMGLDVKKPLDQQIYDEKTGQSWQQYFLQAALDSWKREQSLTLDAQKNGFVLGAEYQEYLDNLETTLKEAAEKAKFESIEAMLKSDMGAAADMSTYRYYMDRYYTGNLYYEEAYRKVDVTLEELEAYFKENAESLKSSYGVDKESGKVYGMDYVMFFPEGATMENLTTETLDQAAWDSAKAKAQALMDKWVSEGATAEDFAKMIEEANKKDNTSGANVGKVLNALTQYFAAEVDVRHVLITPESSGTDENGKAISTEADWEACRQKAQALLDGWRSGEATEDTFHKLAQENSKDGNASTGGLYTGVTQGYMVAEFNDWIFDESRRYGDSDLVKTQFGYHIMYFVKREANWIAKSREGSFGIAANEAISDVKEQYPIEVNYDAIALS
jgi:parvulin-like peptidyl-prolyl isomerase